MLNNKPTMYDYIFIWILAFFVGSAFFIGDHFLDQMLGRTYFTHILVFLLFGGSMSLITFCANFHINRDWGDVRFWTLFFTLPFSLLTMILFNCLPPLKEYLLTHDNYYTREISLIFGLIIGSLFLSLTKGK